MAEPAAKDGRLRIVYAVTVPVCLSYLRGQLRFMRARGYEVTVISSPGEELDRAAMMEGAHVIPLPMAREISPLRDLLSLWRLWRVIRRLQPAITNVGTPKAGLLAGLASLFAGVPCRIYTLHGLRLETAGGLKRRILILAERLACLCAHRVICVSESVREKAAALGIGRPGQLCVLGSGSCNGVDAAAYSLDAIDPQKVIELRWKLGTPQDAPVIGFVGRLTQSKGIAELFCAFRLVRRAIPDVRLLLVGRFEEGEPLSVEVRRAIEADTQVMLPGFVADMAPYYHLTDVVALPSYREGLPGVVLEANAAGKPVVGFRATGTVDAIVDGATGILVPFADVGMLAAALERLLKDKHLNAAMGHAGRERVLREFSQERVWEELSREYARLLQRSGLRLRRTQTGIERQTQPLPLPNLDNLRPRDLQETRCLK